MLFDRCVLFLVAENGLALDEPGNAEGDDGKGFDVEKIKTSIGHGLANMHTRAHAVGGEVDISTTMKEGTTILVWIPRTVRH